MKVTIRKSKRAEQGNVLLMALVVATALGIMLVSYLSLVSNQNLAVARSQAWNSSIPVLESGVEEAMAQIRYHGIEKKLYKPSNLSADNWNNFMKVRQIAGGSNWVSIDTNFPPTITSYGYVRAPLRSDLIMRRVRVVTAPQPLFPDALLAESNMVFQGSARIDSYNPKDGKYDSATNYNAKGNVGSNLTISNAVSIGGKVRIYGRVSTGPGGSTSMKGNASVGDKSWSQAGIQPGYSSDDMNLDIDDPQLPVPPSGTWYPPPTSGSSYVLGNGYYKMDSFSLTASQKILVTNHAVLYLSGGSSYTSKTVGSASIEIQAGASLEIYCANGTFDLGGNALINPNDDATTFQFYGLSTCKTVKLGGTSGFTGVVYAPDAALELNGTGDFFGACVSNTTKVVGTYDFHYPEDLLTKMISKFVVASWNEF